MQHSNFETWYEELRKEDLWFWGRMISRHPNKNLEQIAREIFEAMPESDLKDQRFAFDRLAQKNLNSISNTT